MSFTVEKMRFLNKTWPVSEVPVEISIPLKKLSLQTGSDEFSVQHRKVDKRTRVIRLVWNLGFICCAVNDRNGWIKEPAVCSKMHRRWDSALDGETAQRWLRAGGRALECNSEPTLAGAVSQSRADRVPRSNKHSVMPIPQCHGKWSTISGRIKKYPAKLNVALLNNYIGVFIISNLSLIHRFSLVTIDRQYDVE